MRLEGMKAEGIEDFSSGDSQDMSNISTNLEAVVVTQAVDACRKPSAPLLCSRWLRGWREPELPAKQWDLLSDKGKSLRYQLLWSLFERKQPRAHFQESHPRHQQSLTTGPLETLRSVIQFPILWMGTICAQKQILAVLPVDKQEKSVTILFFPNHFTRPVSACAVSACLARQGTSVFSTVSWLPPSLALCLPILPLFLKNTEDCPVLFLHLPLPLLCSAQKQRLSEANAVYPVCPFSPTSCLIVPLVTNRELWSASW